jgi:drug/metabolite transporter (DMT)-like permease
VSLAQDAAPVRVGAIPPAGLLQLAGSVVLLSSAWPITKQAIGLGVVPIWFAVGRAGFSAVVAFIVLGLLRRLRVPLLADLPAVFAVGLLQLAAFFYLAHAAVAWVPAGRTAILSNVTTIWIAPLSLMVLREPIPLRRWIAAGLGLLGVVVLMGPWAMDWTERDTVVGHIFLLGAAGTFSAAMIVVRRWPPASSMLQLLPWCFALATAVLLPLGFFKSATIGTWPAPALWSIAYIGGLAGPLGTWCVMQAAATLPAMVSSVGFLMTPAAGLLLSAWWLDEKLGADVLLGSALILAGVACSAWPGRR